MPGTHTPLRNPQPLIYSVQGANQQLPQSASYSNPHPQQENPDGHTRPGNVNHQYPRSGAQVQKPTLKLYLALENSPEVLRETIDELQALFIDHYEFNQKEQALSNRQIERRNKTIEEKARIIKEQAQELETLKAPIKEKMTDSSDRVYTKEEALITSTVLRSEQQVSAMFQYAYRFKVQRQLTGYEVILELQLQFNPHQDSHKQALEAFLQVDLGYIHMGRKLSGNPFYHAFTQKLSFTQCQKWLQTRNPILKKTRATDSKFTRWFKSRTSHILIISNKEFDYIVNTQLAWLVAHTVKYRKNKTCPYFISLLILSVGGTTYLVRTFSYGH
jgi:hypothetical protein